MITTISLNPSIDRTVTVEKLTTGALNRVVNTTTTAAGKGINVALAVSALGMDAECIGFMYKEGGKLFEKRLMMHSTPYNFVWCDGCVRTNIKVLDRATDAITEFNESGTGVTDEYLKRMTELVLLHAENTDYLILAGSLPPGCPTDFYRTILQTVDGLGCRCVLDAEGESMRYGLEAKPFLIKPNRHELEIMTGGKLNSLKEIRDAAHQYIDMGVSVVAVSLGSEGAIITDGELSLYAPRLNIDVKSTVGAGDAMVAGLTCGFLGENTLEDAFRMGVACATARCATEGFRVMEKTVYKAFLNMVKMEKL